VCLSLVLSSLCCWNLPLLLCDSVMDSIILLLAVAFVVIVERKLLGGLQLRTRPLYVGILGLLQTIVDGIKLIGKEVN